MSTSAKLIVEIDVSTIGDVIVAPEIASELASRIVKLVNGCDKQYGIAVLRKVEVTHDA